MPGTRRITEAVLNHLGHDNCVATACSRSRSSSRIVTRAFAIDRTSPGPRTSRLASRTPTPTASPTSLYSTGIPPHFPLTSAVIHLHGFKPAFPMCSSNNSSPPLAWSSHIPTSSHPRKMQSRSKHDRSSASYTPSSPPQATARSYVVPDSNFLTAAASATSQNPSSSS